MIDKELAKENHEICLQLLDKFLEICEKYQIVYYTTEGSALGAVRHNGFIPWDYNIDVHLDVANYRKLDEAMKKEKLGDLRWFRPSFRIIPFFMRKDSLDFKIRPNIDITIMGNAPDNPVWRWVLMNVAFLNIKMFKLKNTEVKRPFPYNVLRVLASIFPDSIYWGVLHRFEKRNQKKQTKYLMAYTPSFYGNSELIKREWIGRAPTYGDFEGRKVRIFENYHEYLTNRYGDYMTPVVWEDKGEYNGCFSDHKE